MRLLISPTLLLLFTLAFSIAAPPPREAELANVEEDVLGHKLAVADEPALDGSTTFNGMSVPPMKELNGDNFEEEAKEGYW